MFDWGLFFILVAMGLVGTVAVIPYSLAISGGRIDEMPFSPMVTIALTLAQAAVMLAVMVGLGLLAAQAVGLELPILRALLADEPILPLLTAITPVAVITGALAGALILVLEIAVFRPRMPASIKRSGQNAAAWQGLLASLYGGINEEIMLRLFVVSGGVWLLSRLNNGLTTNVMLWAVIVLAAVLFGLGHLPATARLAPLSPLLVVRALLLNGILGVLAGYLFWRYGLEAAMITHFSADIVLHVLPVPFLRQRNLKTTAHTAINREG